VTVALLAAYAAAAGFAAPACLRRDWLARMPRLAMALWLALSASWVTAVTLAALAIAAPSLLTWSAVGSQRLVAGSHFPAAIATGVLLAAALIMRTAGQLAHDLREAGREQAEHAAFLAAAGHADSLAGALVLDHDAPAAYSVPRGRHRIVVSSATVTLLTQGQLEAVIAHERAHLRGHHQLLLTISRALAHAFPAVTLLARAAEEVAVLAEMAADAAAARSHDPEDLAAALVILARARVRTAALAAGGPAALARINRLLAAEPRAALAARSAGLAACVAALTVATAFACLPLVLAACGLLTWR
jgi:Zn-dependent protease with chaperone function